MTNQCGETCERAKLCAACARELAEPEQEPVAWLRLRDGKLARNDGGNFGDDWMPLYTAPHGIGGQDES